MVLTRRGKEGESTGRMESRGRPARGDQTSTKHMDQRKGAMNALWCPSSLTWEQLGGAALRGLSCCARRLVVPNLLSSVCVTGCSVCGGVAFSAEYWFQEDGGHAVDLTRDNEGYLDFVLIQLAFAHIFHHLHTGGQENISTYSCLRTRPHASCTGTHEDQRPCMLSFYHLCPRATAVTD